MINECLLINVQCNAIHVLWFTELVRVFNDPVLWHGSRDIFQPVFILPLLTHVGPVSQQQSWTMNYSVKDFANCNMRVCQFDRFCIFFVRFFITFCHIIYFSFSIRIKARSPEISQKHLKAVMLGFYTNFTWRKKRTIQANKLRAFFSKWNWYKAKKHALSFIWPVSGKRSSIEDFS